MNPLVLPKISSLNSSLSLAMEAGSLWSMLAGLFVAPPLPEGERHGSRQPDASFPSSQIRDYCKHDDDDWCKSAVNKITTHEEDLRDNQMISSDEEHDTGYDVFSFGAIIFQLLYSHPNKRTTNTIVLDSGATMHITGNFSLLTAFDRAQDLVYRARDGTDLYVAGIGTIIWHKLHIPNVRYVPQLGSGSPTIVSVQQLTSSGYLVMFCGGWCYVKGHSNGSLVGRGRLHDDDGLYHLEYLHIAADDVAVQSAAG